HCYGDALRAPFPTRRSSDLKSCSVSAWDMAASHPGATSSSASQKTNRSPLASLAPVFLAYADPPRAEASAIRRFGRRSRYRATRSEEHTSELQSREKLVCRL